MKPNVRAPAHAATAKPTATLKTVASRRSEDLSFSSLRAMPLLRTVSDLLRVLREPPVLLKNSLVSESRFGVHNSFIHTWALPFKATKGRKIVSESASLDFLNRTQLLKLKMKAIRAGVWFRGLRRIDRALVDLTIMVATTVRSGLLASSVLSVARKLSVFLEDKVGRAMRQTGFSMACKLSQLAQRWGNRAAKGWVNDVGFARYLAVMQINGCLPSG
jgi:hypothetical protein